MGRARSGWPGYSKRSSEDVVDASPNPCRPRVTRAQWQGTIGGQEDLRDSRNVAIVVLGEKPYAEGQGDRTDGMTLDRTDLSALSTVARSGVPIVVVLVSGRPLVVTGELQNWRGLIAAWLPGTEGNGVADVLSGDFRPTGKLPMSWWRTATQIPINVGDTTYDPLFAYGFGLTYP